jgi:hypothetical protein
MAFFNVKLAEIAFLKGILYYTLFYIILFNGIFSIVVTKFGLCIKKGKYRIAFLANAVCSKWHFRAKLMALSLPIFLAALPLPSTHFYAAI